MKSLYLVIALLVAQMVAVDAFAQTETYRLEFLPNSQYTFFEGQTGAPCALGCDYEIAGLFDLNLRGDGARISNADIEIQAISSVVPDQPVTGEDVENWLQSILLVPSGIRDGELPVFALELDVSNGLPSGPFTFEDNGTFYIEFVVGVGGDPLFGDITGGPPARVQGSTSFEFDSRVSSRRIVSVPEPSFGSIAWLGITSVTTYRRKR